MLCDSIHLAAYLSSELFDITLDLGDVGLYMGSSGRQLGVVFT